MISANRTWRVALAIGIVLAATPAVADGGSTGTLQLHSTLTASWQQAACPAGTSTKSQCDAIQGAGVVPGLGRTTESYSYVVDDDTVQATSVHFTATISVPGKGTIAVSAQTPQPICPCIARTIPFDFTVTGGTGAYAGAQGDGKATIGTKEAVWSGSLSVPGYAFDTTPPALSGAKAKIVRATKGAKRMRVTFKVTAQDPGEGSVPVKCTPPSGSLFKIGRTTVRCSAIDANGNVANARFPVTVKGT